MLNEKTPWYLVPVPSSSLHHLTVTVTPWQNSLFQAAYSTSPIHPARQECNLAINHRNLVPLSRPWNLSIFVTSDPSSAGHQCHVSSGAVLCSFQLICRNTLRQPFSEKANSHGGASHVNDRAFRWFQLLAVMSPLSSSPSSWYPRSLSPYLILNSLSHPKSLSHKI